MQAACEGVWQQKCLTPKNKQTQKTSSRPKWLRLSSHPHKQFVKAVFVFLHLRCWRVSRSWTTVCCWACTCWTRGTGGIPTSRAEETERDPWLSECSTPPPWSPSRGTARPPRPSPPTTREWAQLAGRVGGLLSHYAHIFGHAHTLPLSASWSPTFFRSPRRSYTTEVSVCTGTMATHNTNTQPPLGVFTATHLNVNASQRTFPTNIWEAAQTEGGGLRSRRRRAAIL